MAGDATGQVSEMLSAPMEELITALGRGVGAAQAALDRHSIEIQQLIDADPVLGQYGLQASWYQIPTTQLELKVAVAMEQRSTRQSAAPPAAAVAVGDGELAQSLPKLWLQPVNARYSNQFGFNVSASSTVALTIVPVPPPAAVSATPPTHSDADVLDVVRDRLLVDADKEVRGRVSINFNSGARSWFVLQTEQTAAEPALIKLLRVDDLTLAITREEPVEP